MAMKPQQRPTGTMMPTMLRRLHIQTVGPGLIELDERQSHHARDVLRLEIGEDAQKIAVLMPMRL